MHFPVSALTLKIKENYKDYISRFHHLKLYRLRNSICNSRIVASFSNYHCKESIYNLYSKIFLFWKIAFYFCHIVKYDKMDSSNVTDNQIDIHESIRILQAGWSRLNSMHNFSQSRNGKKINSNSFHSIIISITIVIRKIYIC